MNWDELAEVVVWCASVAFGLFTLVRIATRAGFGTGVAMCIGICGPLGLVVLAFADWPALRQRRRADALRRAATPSRDEPGVNA